MTEDTQKHAREMSDEQWQRALTEMDRAGVKRTERQRAAASRAEIERLCGEPKKNGGEPK
ncbi:hypothetical protein MPC4_70073 [Methylocella tundrae]|uniref:Uncharacterized protein n=1 Tax=Methylocella tundrae TaxID=227605 RepID=A0A8B6MCA5_METTU|nr:hypothetical protein [Methylocella tundrae]VTZ52185.1 hypothetical protein MPC4_70073 [Methylocella tundrae]